jgi:hypothetical protein
MLLRSTAWHRRAASDFTGYTDCRIAQPNWRGGIETCGRQLDVFATLVVVDCFNAYSAEFLVCREEIRASLQGAIFHGASGKLSAV